MVKPIKKEKTELPRSEWKQIKLVSKDAFKDLKW